MVRLTTIFGLLALFAGVTPRASFAQEFSLGAGVFTGVFLPSEEIGLDHTLFYGGRVAYAPNPFFRIGFGGFITPAGHTPENDRPYRIYGPMADIEMLFKSRGTQFYLTASPMLMHFKLGVPVLVGPNHGFRDEVVRVPAIGVGAGVSFPLWAGFSMDFIGRDVMAWSKPGFVEGVPGLKNVLNHSPELAVRLSFTWRRKERVATFEDLPISFTNNFQPARASNVQGDQLKHTMGRDHLHTGDNKAKELTSPYRNLQYTEKVILGQVYFENGSYHVTAEQQKAVKKVAEYMKQHPTARIRIRGYTSRSGSNKQNISMAERRVTEIRKQLVQYYQIEPERIEAVTAGIDPEATTNKDAQRVDIWLLEVVGR